MLVGRPCHLCHWIKLLPLFNDSVMPVAVWPFRPEIDDPDQNKVSPFVFSGGEDAGEGGDLMSELMGEVNRREDLRRREGVRTLKQPSALLPPHSVLEHVLESLRAPDSPTDGYGLNQAFIFSALDTELSRGPVDYRRDWSDEDEAHPRLLDRPSFAKVLHKEYPFLIDLSDYTLTGAPIFSEDDHRVTFEVRISVPGTGGRGLGRANLDPRWLVVDFRLGRVREGSHKDCWLIERGIVRGGVDSSAMWL
ncbi:unnamed protein product [Discosporangium mesarthrocarpum]